MALSLDEILSDKPTETVEVAPEPVVETTKDPVEQQQAERNKSIKDTWRDKEQEAQGRVRDPATGQFVTKEAPKEGTTAPKEEPKAEVKVEAKPEPKQEFKPVEELTPKEKAAFAKAADETRKRQALERRLAELEAQAGGGAKEAPKSFWDDPEGALNKQKQEIQQAIVGTRLQTSEAIARGRHQDFDEKVAVFTELAHSVPGLGAQMMASGDPAEFVYRTATNHQLLQQAGGINELRKKIEEETTVKVRKQIEEELRVKAETLAKERAALPGSLTEAPSKGVNRPVWYGPTSMDDILGRKA
jgi:hypothetical protein